MRHYEPLLDAMGTGHLRPWSKQLPAQLDTAFSPTTHGDVPRWLEMLDSLPQRLTSHLDLNSPVVSIGKTEELSDPERAALLATLQDLIPWRKGPYSLFGIDIDTEWRSDWKWDRVVPHLTPLQDRLVLDVGCGNGYHCWRMLGAGARRVIGIDPAMLFVFQFLTLKHFAGEPPVDVLPLPLESVPANLQAFDTVFSMGVLYHRRSPIDHLLQLRDCLRPGGELVLETLVVDGPEGHALMPEGRYARMRNVWFLPSIATTIQWLKRCRFSDIRCVDDSITSADEQRRTPWMPSESLSDFLLPDDPSRTIEGYPAPRRAVFIATRG
jgi:tRNA (mo5U34)-methyltransferase